MTTSRRSWRCLSRRALARISIIVMLGESSMNIGAEETSPILRASLSQSSSFMLPLRMWLSGTFASADSSRMVISERVISRLKKTLVRLLWIDAARHRSSARVELWVGIIDVGPRGRGGRRCRPARSGPAPTPTGRTASIFTAEPSGSAMVCTCPSVSTSSAVVRTCAPQLASTSDRAGRTRDAAVPPLTADPRAGAGRLEQVVVSHWCSASATIDEPSEKVTS